ncbi:DNA-binding transcriptional LysR family regulator [Angulomicrobium tetraedrale]|uniref:DNA-binding transcriptional LysR family regulator n=1 Tax=Ancylobacter tetraedralis TaxID=217068 RepID=A0A839ZGB4_9HYPH|nr:DNA-binding transcriptional LysR family regulator [Ancylobacter tetraedralis]
MSDTLPHDIAELGDGSLIRLVPRWYCDAGAISIYYPSRTLLPAKSRVFIDWVGDAFKAQRLAERFAGSLA